MLQLRKPSVRDVPQMHALMRPHILTEALLPRSERDVLRNLRDYVVAEEDGELVGLASLSVVEAHLAELGAVVCRHPERMATLISAALEEARSLGVERVFVLAPEADPYEALGFKLSDLSNYPEKRDRQCLRCSRLPRCRQLLLECNL